MSVKKLFDSISGKVALITGGSRGLGLQMAEALGEMGARIAVTARKQGELDEAAAHLRQLGVDVLTVQGDLSKFDTIPGMVDKVLAKWGGIDILINNAGTSWGAPVEDHPREAWNKVMDLNINAMFFLTQDVGKRSMIPRRYGKVINISSVAALHAAAPDSPMKTISYHTSKAAVLGFTRQLAAEWGRHNINVNAICPGWFPSKMTKGILDELGVGKMAIEKAPLHRLGDEEDLKGIAVYFASEASRHVTGQHICVDGGAGV